MIAPDARDPRDPRLDRLVAALRPLERALVALSGGVDSSLLALAAVLALGDRALAVTADTPFAARRDIDQAMAMAGRIGINQRIVPLDLLADLGVIANGPDRCYHCKRRVIGAVQDVLPGVPVLDGTNADDDLQRPGRRALRELGARSPLCEAGLTKQDVRELASLIGLPNAQAPSNSCLATRVPRNVAITPERLMRIEAVEDLLHRHGLGNVRARDNDLVMIVEIRSADSPQAERARPELTALAARLGVREIRIDPRRP